MPGSVLRPVNWFRARDVRAGRKRLHVRSAWKDQEEKGDAQAVIGILQLCLDAIVSTVIAYAGMDAFCDFRMRFGIRGSVKLFVAMGLFVAECF